MLYASFGSKILDGLWPRPSCSRGFSGQLLTVAVKTSVLRTGVAGHLHFI